MKKIDVVHFYIMIEHGDVYKGLIFFSERRGYLHFVKNNGIRNGQVYEKRKKNVKYN